MSSQTTFGQLTKPASTDPLDISVLAANWQRIDDILSGAYTPASAFALSQAVKLLHARSGVGSSSFLGGLLLEAGADGTQRAQLLLDNGASLDDAVFGVWESGTTWQEIWRATQGGVLSLAALAKTAAGSPYGAGVIPSVLGATTSQKIQAGSVSLNMTSAAFNTIAVTFPQAFVSSPLVMICQADHGGWRTASAAIFSSPTAFTIDAYMWDSTATVLFNWIAIGN